jgi:hypothetical protein
MLRFMGNWLRGRGWFVAATCLLLAGCGSVGRSHQPSKHVATRALAPAGAVSEVRKYFHGWSCSTMSLTSPTALAADVAANAAGNQFGSGSGPSAQADFIPASGKADGDPYAEFGCAKGGRRIVAWADEIGGVWAAKNGGFAMSGALAESPTSISVPAASRSNPELIDTTLQHDFSKAFASSGASVRPACSPSNSQRSDYYCVVTNTSTHANIIVLYHVDTTSGQVFSLKAGNSTSAQSTAAAQGTGTATTPQSSTTAPDLYASCSNTVDTFAGIETDLRTYLANQGNTTTLHGDFAALGDDLELMGQQADGLRHDSAGVTFQNAAATYSADAGEVNIAGQLQSPPSDFTTVLRQSCPSSWYAAGLPGQTASSNPTSTPTTPTPPTGATVSSGPLATLERYWADVGAHQFAAAYGYLVAGSTGQTESQFVSGEQQAEIRSVKFRGHVDSHESGVATVGVGLLVTRDAQFGCRTWTGSYQVIDEGGVWLIQRASITPSSCG